VTGRPSLPHRMTTTPTSHQAGTLRALAIQREAEGRLDEADRLLSQAAQIAPDDAAIIDGLIAVSHRRGDFARLVQALLARLALAPERAELWSDLGAALERLGQDEPAQAAYKRAGAVAPSFAPALLNLAVQTYRAGHNARASQLSQRARAAGSPVGATLLIEAHSAQNRGQPTLAARGYAAVLACDPAEISAWQGLGALLLGGEEKDRAWTCFARALSLNPHDSAGLANLAETQRRCGSFVEALRLSRRAAALVPDSTVASNTLALAHADLASDAEALLWARRAVSLDRHRADLRVNLGVALKTLGHFDAAERAIRAGLADRPDDADSHMSLATTLFAMGRIEEGFREYEWRHVGRSSRYDAFPAPRWGGRPLGEGKLLVWGEQGVGDEIMFAQYLTAAKPLAPQMIVECDRRLVSMFARSFPGIDFVAKASPPNAALLDKNIVAQIALCSLPHVLGFTLRDLKCQGPFLAPDPDRYKAFEKRLAGIEGLKVGIAWRSKNMEAAVSKRLHATLSDISAILKTDGISTINLQYGDLGPSLSDFNAAHPQHPVITFDDVDLMNDLEDVLALGSHLDLVISTATSSYCLPAAAGVETWLLQSRISYLGFGEENDPCCPKSRGFIREPGESWAGPVAAIVEALRHRIGSMPPPRDGR
jgi:Flp pilus assembly protein TadD